VSNSADTDKLIDGAVKLARSNLTELGVLVSRAVTQFYRDEVPTAVEGLTVKPDDSLGMELFGAFVKIVGAAIPEAEVLIAGTETFIDLLGKEVEKKRSEVASEALQTAKVKLLRVGAALADAADNAATQTEKAAWGPFLQQRAQKIVREHPDWADMDPSDDTNHQTIARHMGYPDPASSDIPGNILAGLRTQFREEAAIVTAGLHFMQDLHDDADRLEYLIGEAEKGTDPDALVAHMGGRDTVYWGHYLGLSRARGKEYALFCMKAHLGEVSPLEMEWALTTGGYSEEDLAWKE
jgi:hypothetical protein